MTHQAPARQTLLELHEALAQRQLREVGAEVASAIAHAVGTPLNVISGRAELIRHDPSNALAQVARIEEQVKKLATGLRQLVDYLALPEPRVAQGAGAPAAPAGPAAAPLEIVDASAVLDDVAALAAPVCRAHGVELAIDGGALTGARVERWHALGTLSSLVSAALRQVAPGASASARIAGSVSPQAVVFELTVPGLGAVQGWQLEHFQTRPLASEGTEFHRAMSICAAVVRGHGGRLQVEASPDGGALVIRFSCRNESAAAVRA